MKKNTAVILLFSVILLAVSACSRGTPPMTDKNDFKTTCLDGVNYYIFTEQSGYVGQGFMSPKYKKDGKLSLCDA